MIKTSNSLPLTISEPSSEDSSDDSSDDLGDGSFGGPSKAHRFEIRFCFMI